MRVFLVVHGFVQGVGYRSLVKKVADRLKVSGMVRNADDGSVHVLASGKDDAVALFKDTIDVDMVHGPQVRHIEEFPEGSEGFPRDARDYDGFVIER